MSSDTTGTKMQLLAAYRQFDKKARAIVGRIAKDRDKLRALLDDYQDILETIDEAERDWDDVLLKMSELL